MIPLCVAVILDLLRSRMPRRHGAMVESLVRTEPCGATWGKQETSLLLTRHHRAGSGHAPEAGASAALPAITAPRSSAWSRPEAWLDRDQ